MGTRSVYYGIHYEMWQSAIKLLDNLWAAYRVYQVASSWHRSLWSSGAPRLWTTGPKVTLNTMHHICLQYSSIWKVSIRISLWFFLAVKWFFFERGETHFVLFVFFFDLFPVHCVFWKFVLPLWLEQGRPDSLHWSSPVQLSVIILLIPQNYVLQKKLASSH